MHTLIAFTTVTYYLSTRLNNKRNQHAANNSYSARHKNKDILY
jgi:hypothetical protein